MNPPRTSKVKLQGADFIQSVEEHPFWILYSRSRESEAMPLKIFFKLKKVAGGSRALLAIGISAIENGYPPDVAYNVIRACHAFSISLNDEGVTTELKIREEISPESKVALSAAGLLGRIAAIMQNDCLQPISLLWLAIREKGEENPLVTLKNPAKAEQAALKGRIQYTEWETWHERPELTAEVAEEFFRLITVNLTDGNLRPIALDTLKETYIKEDGEYAMSFSQLFAHPVIASAIRKAEGTIAFLEQRELDRLEPTWLFKEELRKERESLSTWSSSPALVNRIRCKLAKRLDEVLPIDQFSEDRWRTLSDYYADGSYAVDE